MLDLVRTLTFSFSVIDSLLLLCFNLVMSKLEYASPLWNNITAIDANSCPASRGNLQLYISLAFFLIFLITMLGHLSF